MKAFIFLVLFFAGCFAQAQNSSLVSPGTYLPGLSAEKNYIKNPDCWKNTSFITVSGGTVAQNATTPLNADTNTQCAVTASTSAQTFCWTANFFGEDLKGQNCEAKFVYKGNAANFKTYVTLGTVQVTTDLQLINPSYSQPVSMNFPCGNLSSQATVCLASTGTGSNTVNVAKVYAGKATNLGLGAISTDWQDFPSVAAGALITGSTTNPVYGTVATNVAQYRREGPDLLVRWDYRQTAAGTNGTGLMLFNIPSSICVIDTVRAKANTTASIGQTDSGGIGIMRETYQGSLIGTITPSVYSSSQIAFKDYNYNQANTTGYNISLLNVDQFSATSLTFSLNFRVPCVGFAGNGTIVNINAPSSPTTTRLTSGTGVYFPPTGVKYLKIRMIGGGGGGGGSAAGQNGGAGGTTTFGSQLSCAGGPGGTVNGDDAPSTNGAVCTNTTGLVATLVRGATTNGPSSNANGKGGDGGSSPFGGAGGGDGGSNNAASGSGAANSGSGGGGSGTGGAFTGSGGGAGGYLEIIIPVGQIASSYNYSIGAGGTAAASTQVAGAGGSGVIIIEEFYGAANTPILVGSVSSNSNGAERIERIRVLNNGTASIVSQSDGGWTINRTGVGAVVLTIPSGRFSQAPTCTCNPESGQRICSVVSITATSITTDIRVPSSGASADIDFDVICMGPR